MPLKLLKLNRPIAERQAVWINPDDVTHVFTAGGTVLNALGGEPVPYLVALAMASKGMGLEVGT